MKRCFALLLSVLLLTSSVTVVSADWNYNDDELNWGSDTCAHLEVTVVPAVDSTCVTAGHAAYTQCDDCDTVIYGSAAALPLVGHDYAAVVTDPDCENGGYTTYTCSVCGDSYVADETAATGHNYVPLSALPPTCEEDGFERFYCTHCEDSYITVLEATGHAYDAVVTDPDCENSGYTTHTCSACGDSYVDTETAALGHTYDGNFDADCNVCGAIREVSVRGDVNGDGKVNNRDLGILQRYLNGWDVDMDMIGSDLTEDGRVNNRDLGLLQQMLNE